MMSSGSLKTDGESSLWFVKVGLTFILSSSIGWVLVQQLGQLAGKTDKIWKLTMPLLITPIIIFAMLRITSKCFQSCDSVVADSFAFGVVAGIMIKLNSTKEKMTGSMKLIASASNGKQIEILIKLILENGTQKYWKKSDKLQNLRDI